MPKWAGDNLGERDEFLLRIMHLLVSSPARYQCTMDASKGQIENLREILQLYICVLRDALPTLLYVLYIRLQFRYYGCTAIT